MMKYRDTRQPSEWPMSVTCLPIVAVHRMLHKLRQVCHRSPPAHVFRISVPMLVMAKRRGFLTPSECHDRLVSRLCTGVLCAARCPSPEEGSSENH